MKDKELKDFKAMVKAIDETTTPLKNRWGLDEHGNTVQLTDDEGNILI